MNIITLPLSEIKKPERNMRIHPEKQLREFGRSITMFGQIRPIVIDESNTILAGVGCYEALLLLGHTEGEFFRVGNLSENQKKKLMIADNKIYGLGIDDLDTFNAFLDELAQDLDIPGYDEELLKSMVASAEEVSQKIAEYGTLPPGDIADYEAARERKESLMSAEQEDSLESDTEPTESDDLDESPSIVCPECGVTIWL